LLGFLEQDEKITTVQRQTIAMATMDGQQLRFDDELLIGCSFRYPMVRDGSAGVEQVCQLSGTTSKINPRQTSA
jgi:hypothetical protein